MDINNKWIRAALPALLIHCSIGSVYCWSLFVTPITQHLNATLQQVQFIFSIAIFFLGISAAFFGNLVEQNIKKSILLSMICFCTGLIITGFSISLKCLIGVYIGYGCLMGIGLGLGYISPVKTLMLWFDKQKGLATGIAITGFGFASAIASPLITYLLNITILSNVFYILGLIYVIPMILAFFLIKKPTNYIEQEKYENNFNLSSISKNKTFILIWIMLYINISCGLSLISIASPIMKELKFSIPTIALIISIMGVFNGTGRLIFSTLSDKLKNRNNIYKITFFLSILNVIIALIFNNFTIITLIIVSACYGAGFSNLPSLLSDKFGTKNISKIHGLSLTSWAVAGLTGNQISTLIKNLTNSYISVLIVIGIGYVIGLIICFNIKHQTK